VASPPPPSDEGGARAALGRPPPLKVPVVTLSLPRQLLILALALGVVLPLPLMGVTASPYSPHANPPLAVLGALAISLVTFTALHLWHSLVAAIYLFALALWCSMVDGLGPVGVLMLAAVITGVVLQGGVRASLREDHLFTATAASLALSVAGLFYLSGAVAGFDATARLVAIAHQVMDVSIRLFSEQMTGGGPPTARDQRFLAQLWQMRPEWVWLLPGGAVSLYALALYVLTRLIRRALPGTAERLPPFWAFGAGMFYVHPVIVLCLLDAVAVLLKVPVARLILDNTLWVLLNLYWLAGLAVCHCLMLQFRFRLLMRIWTWALMILFIKYLVAAVGLFDTWFHFRRLGAKFASRGTGVPRS
jgi:hypothetical protein